MKKFFLFICKISLNLKKIKNRDELINDHKVVHVIAILPIGDHIAPYVV